MKAFIFSLIAAVFIFQGCATTSPPPTPPAEEVTVLPPVIVTPEARRAYSWEKNCIGKYCGKPEWSDLIYANFKKNLAVYSAAEDITEICPKYHSLSDKFKLKALGEFWVAVAEKESSFNPASSSVDVGTEGDLGSYSVGLYQMSANDNSAKKFGATFHTLKEGKMNINVAMEQLYKQVKKEKLFLLPNANSMRYWAVILKGNKYSQIAYIKSRTLKYTPECK